jgi:phosphoserine phosphatase
MRSVGTLTRADLAESINRRVGLSRADSLNMVESILDHMCDALAVGDGANDLAMLSEAGMGVALHAKPHVQEGSLIRVNHGDLTALLYLQGYAKAQFST